MGVRQVNLPLFTLGPSTKQQGSLGFTVLNPVLILGIGGGVLERILTFWPCHLTPVEQGLLCGVRGSLSPLGPFQLWHTQLTVQGQPGSLLGDGLHLTR